MTGPVRIGVSACLLGEPVRYDGGHKYDLRIAAGLGCRFSLVPVCPEVECGLPVPREAMRLEGKPDGPRLVAIASRRDLTGRMLDYCSSRLDQLEREELCGFIFKERSPSCGIASVPLHGDGLSGLSAAGLFAREVARRFPTMPLAEAEQLADQAILDDFAERVARYCRTYVSRNG